MEIIRLTEQQFDDMFSPIQNHLDDNASFSGCMFETFGPELDHVINMKDTNRVLTILDCDGETILSSGYHIVNRLGYLILDKPYEFDFEVKLEW